MARSTALASDKQDKETIATLNAQVDELLTKSKPPNKHPRKKKLLLQQAIELQEKLASQLENLKLAEKARDDQGAQVMALKEAI